MKELLFFSNNQKKIIEINQLFKSSKITVHNLNSFKAIKEPRETGKTFFDNAKIKSSRNKPDDQCHLQNLMYYKSSY